MKGIIMAGGSGTRLAPLTHAISKQILPIYDKPMIYYPLSLLMLAGIRDTLIISTPRDVPMLQALLGDGADLGISLSYEVQSQPEGIAQALIIGEDFVGGEPVCLVLGDNVFYGYNLGERLAQIVANFQSGATIFGYHVKNPERYGVVNFDHNGKVIALEEKPQNPTSNFAVTGIYFYDGKAAEIAKALKPSARGELEITDVNREYLRLGDLRFEVLGRGVAWLDTGTFESLLDAGKFVQTIEERQGQKIACLEEIAWRKGFISDEELMVTIRKIGTGSQYGQYVQNLLCEKEKYGDMLVLPSASHE